MAYNSTFTGSQVDAVIQLIQNLMISLTATDNGKFLKVVEGNPAWVTVESAEEVGF